MPFFGRQRCGSRSRTADGCAGSQPALSRSACANACSKTSWFERCHSGAQHAAGRPVADAACFSTRSSTSLRVSASAVEIVHEVDQQELPAELFGRLASTRKSIWRPPERKFAMALVIVDDGLVVDCVVPTQDCCTHWVRPADTGHLSGSARPVHHRPRRFGEHRLTRIGERPPASLWGALSTSCRR